MSISQVRRVQPASSPTKCGASSTSGCPLSAWSRSIPTTRTSRITRALGLRQVRKAAREVRQADLAALAPQEVQDRAERLAGRREEGERQEVQHPSERNGDADRQDRLLGRQLPPGGRAPAGTL